MIKLLKRPKKSLGQNFLVDKNIINKILGIAKLDQKKVVLEIGAGYGHLTEAIANKKPKKIYAVEKDKKLAILLKKKFKNYKNIYIINDDILNIIEKNSFNENLIVLGNLPYNISTKILASLITLKKWPPWYESLIFMFQKEVADRILAKVKTKEYGRLSVLSNWRLEIKKHFNISPNSFFPKPKINSTLLSFNPKKDMFINLKNPKNLEKITQILFSNRRKMINKNFNKLFKNSQLISKSLKINLNMRAEELSGEIFYKMASEYEKLNN